LEKIKILDLKKQIAPIRKEIDAAIKEVVDQANFVFGHQIDELEDAVSRYSNCKFAVGVSNGTDAIRLSLLALGIGPGDGVLCPAFTYYATASAIASIGAIPIFTDIDPLTYNISPLSVEEVLKNKKHLKIKAAVPVHLYGQSADMESILKISRRFKLKLIEDNAQAFGALYKGKKTGTFGDCGAVSFFQSKNLGAFGDAGIILTNLRSLADKLKILRNQGNKRRYHHVVIGYNHRLDVIQAAVLQVKLKYLDQWNKRRQANANYFSRHLLNLPLITPFVAKHNTHIYHQYVLRLKSSNIRLNDYLNSRGIESRIYYTIPLHLQKCFGYLGYKKGDFPESERAAKEVLAIPVHPDLTKAQMDYIIHSIKEFFR